MNRYCCAKACINADNPLEDVEASCVTCSSPYCSKACRKEDSAYHNQFRCTQNDEETRDKKLLEMMIPKDSLPMYNKEIILAFPGPIKGPIPRTFRSVKDPNDIEAQNAFKSIPQLNDQTLKFVHYLINYKDFVPGFYALKDEQIEEMMDLANTQSFERFDELSYAFIEAISNTMINTIMDRKYFDPNIVDFRNVGKGMMTMAYDQVSISCFNLGGSTMRTEFVGLIMTKFMSKTYKKIKDITHTGEYPKDFDNLDELLKIKGSKNKRIIFKAYYDKDSKCVHEESPRYEDYWCIFAVYPFIKYISKDLEKVVEIKDNEKNEK